MSPVDRWAHANRWRRLHPLQKTVFAAALGGSAFVFPTPVAAIIPVIAGLFLRYGAGIPIRAFLRFMALPLSFLSLGAIPLLVQVQPSGFPLVWSMDGIPGWWIGVNGEGVRTAVTVWVRALAVTSSMYVLALTTPVPDLVDMLRRLNVPEILLEVMHLMYRYLFILMEMAQQTYVAQSSRLGYRSWSRSLSSLGRLGAALAVKSRLEVEDLYRALISRGYRGRLTVLPPPWAVCLKTAAWMGAAVVGLAVAAWLVGRRLHG
ncbi:cobalt ECF transporter T component CbiQ [Kyrpidia spormannii]|uniref:Cobalt ECF transporter T component CbiQ n=2 Tax=Kyrpidia spormannii TaxID=2055160 RepID=A0ACA8Z770_9BACL|nr:cobalt ECF transporter T component CbiQ [Kyrpidia spormannii]CAB3390630.1 Cobalt ECF transporter T component CbiQ [Kyrpidia spormannii]CAB3391543.1 Cobalt ECF transporter T component CbiQ [Kyrpidia spormannii]